ncbi:MAG: ATP-dependent DNA helicase RecG [Deltaproteobacteria bacterium]|nr:ATP-dependent DNA helicase RecG [Deltaproteobacteria bacterium]
MWHAVGVRDADRLQNDVASLCRTAFNRVIRPEIRVDRVDGEVLVGVYIPEASDADKPVYSPKIGLPKGAWRRIGSADQRCTDDDLAMFASRAQRVPFDRRPVPEARRADLDDDAVAMFRRQLRESRPGSELHALSDDDLLLAVGGVTRSPSGPVPTAAGLLFFGRKLAIRQHFPGTVVDYVRVRGTKWTGDQGDTYDTLEIREALITGWRRAYSAVLDDLPTTFQLAEGSPLRRNVAKLPDRVLREALVNALVHRDYELNSSIQVRRFANRLEIENPGYSLLAEASLGEHRSIRRNPTLADLFVLLDLAEAKGTGVRRMRERMHEAGLSSPIFENDREARFFRLTLLFHHFLDEADVRWLEAFGELGPGDAQVLIFTRDNGRVTNPQLRAFCGDDTHAATLRLRRLRDRGLLDQQGRGVATFYTLSGPLPERRPQASLFDLGQQSRPKFVPSSDQVLVLASAEHRMSLLELMEVVGSTNRTRFRLRVVLPLLTAGLLSMTEPDRPRSNRQRYVTTVAGREAAGSEGAR